MVGPRNVFKKGTDDILSCVLHISQSSLSYHFDPCEQEGSILVFIFPDSLVFFFPDR